MRRFVGMISGGFGWEPSERIDFSYVCIVTSADSSPGAKFSRGFGWKVGQAKGSPFYNFLCMYMYGYISRFPPQGLNLKQSRIFRSVRWVNLMTGGISLVAEEMSKQELGPSISVAEKKEETKQRLVR
jgi:hypothetical protein